MLQKTCRDFADNELKPIASKTDSEHLYPTEQIKKMGELGLMSVAISEKYSANKFYKFDIKIFRRIVKYKYKFHFIL